MFYIFQWTKEDFYFPGAVYFVMHYVVFHPMKWRFNSAALLFSTSKQNCTGKEKELVGGEFDSYPWLFKLTYIICSHFRRLVRDNRQADEWSRDARFDYWDPDRIIPIHVYFVSFSTCIHLRIKLRKKFSYDGSYLLSYHKKVSTMCRGEFYSHLQCFYFLCNYFRSKSLISIQ